jgi:hypothetical protein
VPRVRRCFVNRGPPPKLRASWTPTLLWLSGCVYHAGARLGRARSVCVTCRVVWTCLQGEKAVLMAVVGGKMSEGINFANDLAR